MPTHAELAGKLLKDAAGFLRILGERNADLKPQMEENAVVFEQMAILISQKPQGMIGDRTHANMAGQLLKDAANFFRSLAAQNEHIKEQMEENAVIYDQIGNQVSADPLGILD